MAACPQGMEIALRVMSPEIIAVDEIGWAHENCMMLDSILSGVKVIATAHASSYSELISRPSLQGFIRLGIFDSYVEIIKGESGISCRAFGKEN